MVIAKKKEKKILNRGIINIFASFNNIILTLCDLNGNVYCWSSSGSVGFKGSKKSTPFAAKIVTENLISKANIYNLKEVLITIKGHGNGRENIIKTLFELGLNIISIEDRTPIAHNGCRPPKKRRL
jgi:small subunit ribosomal protein S11